MCSEATRNTDGWLLSYISVVVFCRSNHCLETSSLCDMFNRTTEGTPHYANYALWKPPCVEDFQHIPLDSPFKFNHLEQQAGWWFFLVIIRPLARYVILRVARAPGMPGTFSPPPLVSDPDMHHGTCVTHVPWCMPGSVTSGFLWSRWLGNVPGIPGACATRNFTHLVRGPWLTNVLQICMPYDCS